MLDRIRSPRRVAVQQISLLPLLGLAGLALLTAGQVACSPGGDDDFFTEDARGYGLAGYGQAPAPAAPGASCSGASRSCPSSPPCAEVPGCYMHTRYRASGSNEYSCNGSPTYECRDYSSAESCQKAGCTWK